jgi:hypothetical protein
MLKHSILTAFTIATIAVSAVPVTTSSAVAQRLPNGPNCLAAPCQTTPGGTATTYQCSTGLGHLRRVYEEELDGIDDPLRVAIVPVCIGDDYGLMRSDGNAGALRQIIADNDAMTEALFQENFGSDDVVGIRMRGEDSVILYVHPFHH